jgi:cytochrome c oxidase subunit IV
MAQQHPPQGTGWIWKTFWILLIITTVEVALGIVQPEALEGDLFGTRYLNYIFIILTLVKAYYIVAFFMHLKYERKGLQWTIYLPALILIPYLTFIVLTEGSYLFG